MMKLLTIATILLSPGAVIAQTVEGLSKEHVLTIGAGYKKLNDPFIMRRPLKGNTFNAGYAFMRSTATKKEAIAVNWDNGSFGSNETKVRSNDIDLRFSQGFSLWRSGDGRLNSYWGYSINTNSSFISSSSAEDNKYSWCTSANLSLYQSLVYTVRDNKFTLDISMPVVGAASRPGSKSYDHDTFNGLLYDSYSDLFLTSLHNQRSVSASLDFRRALNERMRIILGGHYQYNRIEKDDVYRETKMGVYAGISCSLK